MKSVVEYVKKSISEIKIIYKTYKQTIHAIVLGAMILVIGSHVTKKANNDVIDENYVLRNEVYKSNLKLQMMIHIYNVQNDSLNIYKTYLINCQRQQINENNQRAR